MVGGEIKEHINRPDLSPDKTDKDMLKLLAGDFKYTPEIKDKVRQIAERIMAAEKSLDMKSINEKLQLKPNRQKEFIDLDANYKINMLSRYQVYEGLNKAERSFVEENKEYVQALKNLVEMHNKAKEYVEAESLTFPVSKAA